MNTDLTSVTPPPGLVAWLHNARRVVVLTGAGMSAESGIPTFRDKLTGLWARFKAEDLATPEAFKRDPDMVWAWYEARRRQAAAAQPNAGHLALAALAAQTRFEDFCVITQNVDDLHERAGSFGVIHLHGSIFSPRCEACQTDYVAAVAAPIPAFEPMPDVDHLAPPQCARCGGRVRPGVVWFGEELPRKAWHSAEDHVEKADLVIVVGTSGVVQPAASLASTAQRHGANVAVINPDARPDRAASTLLWQVTAAVGLPALCAALAAHTDGER